MKDKIKARLKELFPGVNLSQARLDAIADKLSAKITDEAGIDEQLNFLNEVQPFQEIAAFDDYQRAKAARDRQQQQNNQQQSSQQNNQQQQGQQSNQQGATQTDDTPAWAKALLDKVSALETKDRTQSMQQRLQGHDKLKSVPQSFYRGRPLPSKDDEFDSFVDTIAADFADFQKETNATTLTGGQPPIAGTPAATTAAVDAAIDAWAGPSKKTDKT
ncbi:hypothetical protein SAMN05444008_102379 [Cnuella takakiae]|uniref:Uncharacterized protein n=1 Tax=Cnuella takakiae TaxID=1302690 RepID=A0A1M4VTR0_9BACT|nr:hypothetical protein [Cnuella takakiae]OLY92501.1 hypothetical protein BUE76_11835 [Cnuella takakiae]SHE72338.1 hypothetical protein SAMN05444008_102379 [Cnuella takakiae]